MGKGTILTLKAILDLWVTYFNFDIAILSLNVYAVYPAGFVYIFAMLRYITEKGENILIAQCIFAGIYILNLTVVLSLYLEAASVPIITVCFLILSKRIHSIYVLRMFNDCIAVLLGYISILLLAKRRYRLGSIFHSLAISVKMNMFLHSPGVLLVLLLGAGLRETIFCLSLCAFVQLALGYPFLSTYPTEYITKAFELSRVFLFKWTVNFKFLPESVFVSRELSIILLLLTALTYILFARKWIVEVS